MEGGVNGEGKGRRRIHGLGWISKDNGVLM